MVTRVLRTKPWEVGARLRDLGLTVDVLREVALDGFRARQSAGPLFPPTFPGTTAWAHCVNGLRSRLLPQGWRAADPGNFSMTISDLRRIYIVVATGDENAGLPFGELPSTKTPKGMKTEDAVRRQGSFWPDDDTATPAFCGTENYVGFWFLLNLSGRTIFTELSAPSDIQDNKICDWAERNVLPKIDLDDTPLSRPDETDDPFGPQVEVPVKRIR